jgi:pimeloyl-ACP methyl ester carboxylesterase
MLRRLFLGVVVAGLAAGCAPDIDQQDPPEVSAATIASFSPNTEEPCESKMPFPSDLIKNSSGTLDIPFCPGDDAVTVGTKIGLRTLDGYSVNTALYTYFTDDIQAGSTVGNTFLLNTTTRDLVSVVPIWNSDDKQLLLMPTQALDPGTLYVAALTTGVKDAGGNAVISDQVFSFAKSSEALIDENNFSRFASVSDSQANQLEPVRQAYDGILTMLAGAPVNKSRDEILVAWFFTTQTVYDAMPALATAVGAVPAVIDQQSSVPAAEHPFLADVDPADGYADATGLPVSNLEMVYSGTMTVTSLLTDTGTFGLDDTGAPATERVPIDYMLVTPSNLGTCTYDYGKVAIFVHALGRCKNDALALANMFAGLCYATLSLDGPRAGARSVNNLGDQDVDGCPDQPETPEFIALPGESPNPFAVRDHLREWGLELVQIAAAAAATPKALAGESSTVTADIALVGLSWGGMAATHAASLSSDVDLLVTMASSADMGAIFQPLIQESMIASLTAAGVDVGTPAGQLALTAAVGEALATFVWALEPSDPLYSAAEVPDSLPVLPLVFDPGSVGEAPLHASSTQQKLSAALGATTSDVTFTFACTDSGTETPVCDDGPAALGGGLQPCASDGVTACAVLDVDSGECDQNPDCVQLSADECGLRCATLDVASGACSTDPDCAPLSDTVCGLSAYRVSLDKLTAIQTMIGTFIASGGAAPLTPDTVTACP